MCRVLIVDDSVFMRMHLKTMLEKNGFKVIGEAENGRVAVAKYLELKPDFVTMDITMPDMDGIEAVKQIRQIDDNAKIIVVSAMGQEPFIREALMAGARGFIIKPFKEAHVLKTISSLEPSDTLKSKSAIKK